MIYTLLFLVGSALYALVYAVIYFGNSRTPFFLSLGITALLVAMLYFFMRRQKKKGPWDSLGNLFILLILVSIISFVIIVVTGIHASTYLNTSEWSGNYLYRISPVVLLIVNVVNIVSLAVQRAVRD
jgi:hypothetical protein